MSYELSKNGSIIRSEDRAIIPLDNENSDYQEYAQWIAEGGLVIPYLPSKEEVVAMYEKVLDDHMDSVARQYRYDNRYTFALRAAFNGPYHEEGEKFALWMDGCNYLALNLLNDCMKELKPIPTVEEFIGMLPKFDIQ